MRSQASEDSWDSLDSAASGPPGLVGKRATQPCPCGYAGDPRRECRCTPAQIERYRSRVSGPFLDRIDIRVAVPRLPPEDLAGQRGEGSAAVRARVSRCHAHQRSARGKLNAALGAAETEHYCRLRKPERGFLVQAITRLGESPRSFHHVLRLARTVADLAGRDTIRRTDLLEALALRRLA